MADRRYTKSHEWVTVDGKTVTVGNHGLCSVAARRRRFPRAPEHRPQARGARELRVVESESGERPLLAGRWAGHSGQRTS